MSKPRIDLFVDDNLVMHEHGIEDLNSSVSDAFVNTTGDTMTGALNFSSAGITNAESVTYDITQTRTPIEGETIWNDDAKTLEVGLKGGFPLEIGLQQVELCVNKTGSSISKGKVVYINGGQGNRPTITLADNSTDATSARTFGVTANAINNNNSGYVVSSGIVTGLDTNAYTAGTQLYLSTSGDMTSTKPVSPAHMVYVAKVLTQSTTVGAIHVGVMNGFEIDELHDVSITSLANKDTIAYDSTSSLWKNKSLATLKTDLDLTGTNSGDVTVTDTASVDLTLSGQALSAIVLPAGVDHGGLGGLLDDDHTQYALLAGRSGGQSLSGGTAANDDLTLQGTTDATRTTSYVILQPNGGNVGIGTTAPIAKLNIASDSSATSLILDRYRASSAFGSYFIGRHSRSDTIGANVIVNANDEVFTLEADGANGTDYTALGQIVFAVDGTPGSTNDMPGRIVFRTTPDGSGTLAERMRITNAGKVGIGTTSPEAKLQIFSSSVDDALMLSGSSLSNNARKFSGIIGKHYTNAEEPSGIIWYDSNVSSSEVNFGGGTSVLNAPTDITFWAAANTTTTTGTEYLHIYGNGAKVVFPNGNVGINDTAPSAQLHVDQTSTTAAKPTLRLQQADLSEEFIRFDTTVGTGNPTNTSALGTYYGRVRVYVEGVGQKWLALYNT